jgi:two-component system, NtrC family, response regulator AtoC
MHKKTVIVVDDDKTILTALRMSLEGEYHVYTAKSGTEGVKLVRDKEPDLVLLDIGLPDTSGIDVIERIKSLDPEIVVIMITAVEDTKMVVRALKLGAYDYLVKPIDARELKNTLKNALETRCLKDKIRRIQKQNKERYHFDLIGNSSEVKKMIETAQRVAKSVDTPVLILGETGTGKGVLARVIHYNFSELPGPFVAVNCSAITHDLFESEVFGYERGAFTGAKSEGKIGRFDEAAGGTLFLDEIGSMSLASQSKLLGVLDDRAFHRVGGNKTQRVSARIIAATNTDLEKAVEDGRFRRDLFFRLNVVSIHIPALRERPDDIMPLTDHFIARFNKKCSKKFSRVSQEASRILLEYTWPGNVRELRNTLERVILLETGSTILPDHLAFLQLQKDAAAPAKTDLKGVFWGFEETINKTILDALGRSRGNVTEASRLLHMPAHKMRYRIKKHRLSVDR